MHNGVGACGTPWRDVFARTRNVFTQSHRSPQHSHIVRMHPMPRDAMMVGRKRGDEHIYIYIYRERERARCIEIDRERERERERDNQREREIYRE